ncbi:MAG: hypothetical protein JXB04_11365 [Kiritimatiellae bacterium]|nr:hypothetical protein [Kiritimatiellia bacterium]
MTTGSRVVSMLLWLSALALASVVAISLASSRVGEHRSSTYGAAYSRFEHSWGGEIGIPPARFFLDRTFMEEVFDSEARRFRKVEKTERIPLVPESIAIAAKVDYGEQKQGWLKFNAFEAESEDTYVVGNGTEYAGKLLIEAPKPSGAKLMHGYRIELPGQEAPVVRPSKKARTLVADFAPGKTTTVVIRYATKGMDVLKYNLSDYADNVIEDLSAVLDVNTTDFDVYRFGLPHAKSVAGDGARIEFNLKDFATTQDLGITFLSRQLYLDQVQSLMGYAPLSPILFLLVIFFLSQVKNIRFNALHYAFIMIINVFYFLFVAYLVRFVGVWMTFTIAAALTAGMFFAYCPGVLGWRFATRVAGVYLFLLTVVFSLIFLMPIFRGLLFLTLIFVILMSLMVRIGRSDISRWPVVMG